MNKDWGKPASFHSKQSAKHRIEIVRLGLILSDEALLYETLQEPNTAHTRYESSMRHFSHANASLRMAETLLSGQG